MDRSSRFTTQAIKFEGIVTMPLLRQLPGAVWVALGIGVGIGLTLGSLRWQSEGWAQLTVPNVPQGPFSGPAAAPGTAVLPPGKPDARIGDGSSRRFNSVQPEAAIALTPEEQISIRVYEICNRSVVHIATKARQVESFLTVKLREGSGSGAVIDPQGHILTNYHVIEGARDVTVSLYNGSTYQAKVIGIDPESDIAVLKIDAPPQELDPLPLGDSTNLKVGQRIYAIGNPFGLERTMSTGIISSLNRQLPAGQNRTMRSLIQLDISLNQGNSGGPLINGRGELIGMNTAIVSTSGDSAGVGFAIPVNTINRIVPQLLTEGRVIRPTIGITRLYENDEGILIVTLAPGGPAERAGLRGVTLKTKTIQKGIFEYKQPVLDAKTADLIIAANGQPVRVADDLLGIIESSRPGDVVELTIVRGGQQQKVRVTLGTSDPSNER